MLSTLIANLISRPPSPIADQQLRQKHDLNIQAFEHVQIARKLSAWLDHGQRQRYDDDDDKDNIIVSNISEYIDRDWETTPELVSTPPSPDCPSSRDQPLCSSRKCSLSTAGVFHARAEPTNLVLDLTSPPTSFSSSSSNDTPRLKRKRCDSDDEDAGRSQPRKKPTQGEMDRPMHSMLTRMRAQNKRNFLGALSDESRQVILKRENSPPRITEMAVKASIPEEFSKGCG